MWAGALDGSSKIRSRAGRRPPWAVVEEAGDVWVADGYGENVHRFDARGRHMQTLTGEEGAGRFACPHGVVVDRRRGEPELYVSDRTNARIQVYDIGGSFAPKSARYSLKARLRARGQR